MNATNVSDESKVDEGSTEKQTSEERITQRDVSRKSDWTLAQLGAIGFPAGVIGAAAVVACSYLLFAVGVSGALGVDAPVSLKAPDIYRPLFWGGLWGILFGVLARPAWNRLYVFGFLFVLAPLLALFLFFLPLGGLGFFGLHKGPAFTLYLLLVNLPFGIVTALAARAIIGAKR